MQGFNVLYPTSYLLIVLGLLLAVVPVLPGSLVVWLGILAWASADGFHALGWPTLGVLAVIALAALAGDITVTMWISRKTGTSWKAVAGSIVGGLLGGVVCSPLLPVIGTIIGGIAGSLVGIIVVEYLLQRNLRAALKAGSGFILGYLASAVVRLTLCLLMIAIFLLKAFVF